MKKILIVSFDYKIGGIQSAFVNLVNYLSKFYLIDVLTMAPTGPLKHDILVNENINFLKIDDKLNIFGLTQKESFKKPLIFFKRFFYWFYAKKNGFPSILNKELGKYKVFGKYDLAISFANNGNINSLRCGPNFIVLNCVSAKKKIAVLHNDFEKSKLNYTYNIDEYQKFDYVCGVSRSCCEIIKKYLPPNKVCLLPNLVSIEKILHLAEEYDVKKENGYINILSVCRLSEEKGLDLGIKILDKIAKEGKMNILWRIVGGGKILKKLKDQYLDLKNNFLKIEFIGEKTNPYPFFKASDFYFIPSRHEAAPMVILEAKVLGLPIISSNFSSAYEMLDNNDFIFDLYKVNFEKMKVYLNTSHTDVLNTPFINKNIYRILEDLQCEDGKHLI